MSKKKYFLLISIFFIIFFYSFKFDLIVGGFFRDVVLDIQKNIVSYSKKIVDYYFSITKLNSLNSNLLKQLQVLKKCEILNKIYETKIIQFEKLLSLNQVKYDLILAKAISYINLNNYSLVFLDLKSNTVKTILPLLDLKGYASGIIVRKNHRYIGILNNNKKANYAVFVGKQRAPGITMGYKNGLLMIKFVPIFYKIKKNDLVTTSGLDNIFPAGIKVGNVEKVSINNQAQIVFVKPFGEINSNYFYTLSRIMQ